MNAVKLALAGFLVPYIYVFNPILVLVGVESRTALLAVLVVVIFGIAFLALRNREKAPRVRIAWGAAAALSLAVLAYLIHGGRIPLQFVLAIFTALIGVFLLGMSTVGHYKVVMPSWMRALALGARSVFGSRNCLGFCGYPYSCDDSSPSDRSGKKRRDGTLKSKGNML
jgi:TRAP-type uncharacterized transport system fused permease subunit